MAGNPMKASSTSIPFAKRGARIVLSTLGSLGDLHPYIALGLGLKARGHDVVLATSGFYESRITSQGLGFHAIRPDLPQLHNNKEMMRRAMDLRTGTEFVVRDLVMPSLRETFEDTMAAAQGADLLVSHILTFSVRLAAELLKLPWASTILAPIGFLSIHDPPVLPTAPFLGDWRFLGSPFHQMLFSFGRRKIRTWTQPLHHFRAELGLPSLSQDPLLEGQHAPDLVLALFSPSFAGIQKDWPSQTITTGFPWFDQDEVPELDGELRDFLDSGPAPIVFTLGSSAVRDAGSFFDHSVEAARRLRQRALLLIGKEAGNHLPNLPDGMLTREYAPFSEVFPRASVIVHQGGIGTTAQALRSGRPMLVMPYAHDQPDNASRLKRLGVARVLPRIQYKPLRVASELHQLLKNQAYSRRAAALASRIRQEDGVGQACAALEKLL
ncbi:MAG: glycosyltransferase [Gemmataceae bacterium]